MGAFAFLITIILIAIGFTFESIWGTKVTQKNVYDKKVAFKTIDSFFKHLNITYDKYYATIHMSNYFHYLCNEYNTTNLVIANPSYYSSFFNSSVNCANISLDPNKQFRYKNIILFSDSVMCRAVLNDANGAINIQYNTCKRLKDWYNDSIITKIDYGILKSFVPPNPKFAYEKPAVFIEGTLEYPANRLTYVPYLKMEGVLFKRIGKNDLKIVKIYPINTLKIIENKVAYANNLIDTYSYYIRGYAKNIFKTTNYNPYVFKYSLASLFYSDSQNLYDKKAVFLPGITYYGLDTSLLVSLPNIYRYTEINGYTLSQGGDGNPLEETPPASAYEVLTRDPTGGDDSVYRNDDFTNLDVTQKLYAMANSSSNTLKSFDPSEWDSAQKDVLFALLRLGRDCKAGDYKNPYCDKYIWYNSASKVSATSVTPNIFKYLYVKQYEDIYNETTFKGPLQYGAVYLSVNVNPNTGEKTADVNITTINDFYLKNFHLDLNKNLLGKNNPFFGTYVYYPGTNMSPDKINLTLLVDNTSNIDYGIPLINSKTVAIYNGYSIAFAIPYVYDVSDFGQSSGKSLMPGLFIKVYSVVTVN